MSLRAPYPAPFPIDPSTPRAGTTVGPYGDSELLALIQHTIELMPELMAMYEAREASKVQDIAAHVPAAQPEPARTSFELAVTAAAADQFDARIAA
jgi:hypothetical protein